MANIGKVKISNKILLKMLDFEDGEILGIYQDPNVYHSDEFTILIKHPDMPEAIEHYPYQEVHPVWLMHYGDDGSVVRIERIQPPKIKEHQNAV